MPFPSSSPNHPEIIFLNREGEWLANGQAITHEATLRAFAQNLHRQEDGSWWIQIGREKKQVHVEDTAYFVKRLQGNPKQGYEIVLSNDTTEALLPQTLKLTPGRLTCLTHRGHEAKFLRAPYSEILLQALQNEGGSYQLQIQGLTLTIGQPLPKSILFFDGVCGLCNRVVDFLMGVDHQQQLHFAPLQGRTAAALLPENTRIQLKSVVFFQNGKSYEQSDAVLAAIAQVGGYWRCSIIFRLVPRSIRNWAYDVIANHRYSWFGKKETCRLPSPSERGRILD